MTSGRSASLKAGNECARRKRTWRHASPFPTGWNGNRFPRAGRIATKRFGGIGWSTSRSIVETCRWGCGARQLQLEGHQSAEEAEWLAKELRRLIDPKDSGRLDTVAACEAAAGQFELAIATQEAVMQLLSERFDPQSPAY